MFDDYVLYLLESLHCQERANELMQAMKGEGSTGELNLRWGCGDLAICLKLSLCPVSLIPRARDASRVSGSGAEELTPSSSVEGTCVCGNHGRA